MIAEFHGHDRRSGVYLIRGPSGVYVGSTKNFYARFCAHLCAFRTGHHNRGLRRDHAMHGLDAFTMEVVALADLASAREIESSVILGLIGPGCYNMRKRVPSTSGRKLSEEHKRKLAAFMKANPDNMARLERARETRRLKRESRMAAGLPSVEYTETSRRNLVASAAAARAVLHAKSVARLAKIREAIASGMSRREVMSTMGYSDSTIRKALRKREDER